MCEEVRNSGLGIHGFKLLLAAARPWGVNGRREGWQAGSRQEGWLGEVYKLRDTSGDTWREACSDPSEASPQGLHPEEATSQTPRCCHLPLARWPPEDNREVRRRSPSSLSTATLFSTAGAAAIVAICCHSVFHGWRCCHWCLLLPPSP